MASFRQRGNNYYARVSISKNSMYTEKEIPLLSSSKAEALSRLSIVNKQEKHIKQGIDIQFPWDNETGQIAIQRYTIDKATKEYIKNCKSKGMRNKTIEIYILALNHFMAITGRKIPVKAISTSYIDRFISHFRKIHSVTTININLRAIKTFINWNHKRGLITDIPIIEQLLIEEEPPQYLSDSQFEKILALDWLQDRYKKAYEFYRETGCRLKEPFFATLNNNWLEIPKEYSKNRKARYVQLNDRLILIYQQMKKHYNEHPTEDRIKYYSKQFQKSLRCLGIKHKRLHSLRHTYCIRRLIQTNGNIFLVRDELGHKNVSTTEKYSKIDIKRLENDFPSLFKNQRRSWTKFPILDINSFT